MSSAESPRTGAEPISGMVTMPTATAAMPATAATRRKPSGAWAVSGTETMPPAIGVDSKVVRTSVMWFSSRGGWLGA